jgi:hypothetical protein
LLPTLDFESSASTSSATPALQAVGLKGICYKMIWPVHVSTLSIAKGIAIGLKSAKICSRPAHFSLRFLKSDNLLREERIIRELWSFGKVPV